MCLTSVSRIYEWAKIHLTPIVTAQQKAASLIVNSGNRVREARWEVFMFAPDTIDNAFRLSIVLPKPGGQAQRCDSKPILRVPGGYQVARWIRPPQVEARNPARRVGPENFPVHKRVYASKGAPVLPEIDYFSKLLCVDEVQEILAIDCKPSGGCGL